MKLVVTRHPALVEYLKETGLISDGDYELIAHATVEDVKGKDVIGVLPINLAAEAASVTDVPLNIPAERRGQELGLSEVRAYAGPPRKYVVKEVTS